jgi:hypothetical protein
MRKDSTSSRPASRNCSLPLRYSVFTQARREIGRKERVQVPYDEGRASPRHSSWEVGEQRQTAARGVDGAKGGGQGERDRARHAPDPEPGKHVPRAGSCTASRRQTLEVGARCGNTARPDLCGGHAVTRVPTAILDPKRKVRMQFRSAEGDPFRTSGHKSSFWNDRLPFKMPGGRRA